MQPLAAKYNLQLVSPTFHSPNLDWSAGFLKACVDLKDHPDYPCDYTLIKAMSIHDYRCKSSKVTSRYASKTGSFFTDMEAALNGYGQVDW
jgi:hypothetical protein